VVSDNWRNYEPSATFDPVDQVGYQGVKTFEYTIIPRNSGELETPEIAFNFFNPDTAKYVELPIPGESVTVAPNPNARPAQPKVRNPVAARRGPELLPIATNPGKWVRSIKPVLTNPFFWGAQVIPALAFGLLFVRRREQLRLQNDPAYARRVRAAQMVNDERDRARRAVLGKQVVAFYEAAQRGVQAAAGQTVEAEPGSLTAADVDRIAQAKGLSNKQRDTLKAFFETGDAIRFSGVSAAEVHFESELARLEEVLQALGGSTE